MTRSFDYVKATRRSAPGRILGFAKWERPYLPTELKPPSDDASEKVVESVDEELEATFAASENRAFIKDFKTRARTIREEYHAGRPYWYLVRATTGGVARSTQTNGC